MSVENVHQHQADAQWAEECEAAEDLLRMVSPSSKAYRFECSCGERFKKVSHAVSCCKCRTYTTTGYCTEVTDIETGLVIYQRAA